MSIRKTLLLTGMATMALALTAPVAQAEWLHDHEPITEETTIHMEGFFEFTNNAGTSFGCPMTAVIVGDPDGTGQMTEFKPTTTTNCVGEGTFAGCDLQSHASPGLPWTAHANTAGDEITVTNARLTYVFTNCESPSLEIRFPELTLTPDDPTTIDTATVSGNATLFAFHIFPAGAGEFKGTMHATEPGTYGIQ